MNKAKVGLWVAMIGITAASILFAASPTVKNSATPQYTEENQNPFKGVVFFKNPLTEKLALYFAFELQPEHEYSIQITTDGVNWVEIEHRSMKGISHEVYESWNVQDPCNGIWPRVLDVTP